jgi:hypothetical protein
LFSFFQSCPCILERQLFVFLQHFSLPIEHKSKKDQELIRTLLTTVFSKTPPYSGRPIEGSSPPAFFVLFCSSFWYGAMLFCGIFVLPHAFFLPYHCLNVFVSVGTNSTKWMADHGSARKEGHWRTTYALASSITRMHIQIWSPSSTASQVCSPRSKSTWHQASLFNSITSLFTQKRGRV